MPHLFLAQKSTAKIDIGNGPSIFEIVLLEKMWRYPFRRTTLMTDSDHSHSKSSLLVLQHLQPMEFYFVFLVEVSVLTVNQIVSTFLAVAIVNQVGKL